MCLCSVHDFDKNGFTQSDWFLGWFDFWIQEAHGLSPTDEQSLTSDPYIKLTLLPEKKHRVKTRVLRKTLDPAFDETFSFYGIPLARVSELALHFMVLSFDRFSRDEVIGETLVPLTGIDLTEGRVLMSREIIKRNVKVKSVWTLKIHVCFVLLIFSSTCFCSVIFHWFPLCWIVRVNFLCTLNIVTDFPAANKP